MANIVKDNKAIVDSKKFFIDTANVETIREKEHLSIKNALGMTSYQSTWIYANNFSVIQAATDYHNHSRNDQICILNFTDSVNPAQDYLNGGVSQEACLCRQTLLYDTIIKSPMFKENQAQGKTYEGSDTMIYSPNVYVIRNDKNELLKQPFMVNIISSAAVNQSNGIIPNSKKIMEQRIRKIVLLAAYKRNDVLILGSFGCGAYKNDPKTIAEIFQKILVEEGLKDHFKLIIFPIFSDNSMLQIFQTAFLFNH